MIKQIKRGKGAPVLILFFLLILLIILVLSVRIRTVTVSGNEKYTGEQIENFIFDSKMSRNSVYCYYQSKFRQHKQIPFVEDYKIVFRSPTDVEIIIYEKSIVGYVSYMSSLMYFDKDGIIVESTNEKLDGIPMITGLKFGHIVLHKPLPIGDDKIFDEILNLTQILAGAELKVDEIHYNSNREAELTIGKLRVILGDHSEMNGKIAELNDMLSAYADLEGTLYLDVYEKNNPMFRIEKQQ